MLGEQLYSIQLQHGKNRPLVCLLQGLAELYEFKAEYPHYDVDAQIEELEVEFFRDYVKRGLKKIEDEKTSKGEL